MLNRKNIFLILLVVLISIFLREFLNSRKSRHPYVDLNTEQLIQKYGYPVEVHEVTTEDGYILTLHRINHGREKHAKKRIPVLMMHGFSQSAINFVYLGPGKALSLFLADVGYDVWLGNARGTTNSRRHKTLDPNRDWQFWDFSLHEIGTHDTPAFIDHILNVTGENHIHYVGFSQGTSVFFILTSEKPQYASKVKFMTALGPAIFLKDPIGPFLGLFVRYRKFIEIFLEVFNFQEFLSTDSLIAAYLKQICNEHSVFVDLCRIHTFLLHGFNPEGVNKTSLSLIYSSTPAGASRKQMMHIVQLMSSGEFRQYDLGTKGNLQKYRQEEPPTYNLSKATTSIALYYSSNDWTVNINNIEKVLKALPNVVKSYLVPWDKFNHDDFIHADKAPEILYNSVIEEILKY